MDSITPAANWNGSGTNHDYAVVKTDQAFANDNGSMSITSAADSYIDDFDMHNLAHPAYGPNCSWTGWVCNDAPWGCGLMYRHKAGIANLTANRIKTRHDGVDGHSGSPIYYCPAGNADRCESGDTGYITGIWSGWYNGLEDGHRGPKGSAIRSWVIANTP